MLGSSRRLREIGSNGGGRVAEQRKRGVARGVTLHTLLAHTCFVKYEGKKNGIGFALERRDLGPKTPMSLFPQGPSPEDY